MYAVVFPGQGAQHPGMGVDLCRHVPEAQAVFDEASEALGLDVAELCFASTEEELRRTENAQVALFTCGLAAWFALRERVPPAFAFAGHSVGEYAAVVAAGLLPLADGARLVRRRGELMAASGQGRPGGMAAVLGLDRECVARACAEVDGEGECVVANDNCPGQIVVSGDLDTVQRASALLTERGAKRVMPLNVSGAFHSPLMEPSAEEFGQVLANAPFGNGGDAKVYANVTAEPVADPSEWPWLLKRQLVAPVRWCETVQAMARDGVTTVVECGAGEVLSGLVRRIDKSLRTLRVVDRATLEETAAQLTEVAA